MSVRVHFYIREQVPGGFTYTGSDVLLLDEAPSVGDVVYLRLPEGNHGRVVEREWMYAGRGSVAWPANLEGQKDPLLLDVMVEPTTNIFRDEIYEPEDEG